MKRILVLVLVLASGLFAQDVKAPSLKPEDEIVLLRYAKQMSDLQDQYDKLYNQFLQSKEMVSLNSQSTQLASQFNTASTTALKNSGADITKWAIDPRTIQLVPIPQPASK